MHTNPLIRRYRLLLTLILLMCGCVVYGQSPLSSGNPAQLTTIQNAPQRDTNQNKSNTDKWNGRDARVYYERLNTARIFTPDTSLHTFHRRPFVQPWKRDLGNLGSPVNDLLFTPEQRVGPTLGYRVFDAYRFHVDSLGYYNTTRAYSVFGYQLGSKLEQVASLFHTQNIRPNWNFAVDYRKVNSPGFYKLQRVNNDYGAATTNYKSENKRYTLYAAGTYNNSQHDENGGIVSDTFLLNQAYDERKTIPVTYQSSFSNNRSAVTNRLRDFTALLQHSYTWGELDTTYSADSTQYAYHLKPRFSITHKMYAGSEKHTYKDLTPDSLRYVPYFNRSFLGSGYYAQGADSVFSQQKWWFIDNSVLLGGFLGNEAKQLRFTAGAGTRYDVFKTGPVPTLIPDSLPKQVYEIGYDRNSVVSNYLTGEIRKEALQAGQWQYLANAQFFLTGQYAGNLQLNASIGKSIKPLEGFFSAGFNQRIQDAPYSYTIYGTAYHKLQTSFDKENITLLYATLESPALRLSGGVRNYLIANYIYINEQQKPAQYATAFNLAQAWARKLFKLGNFYLDNELVYQQVPGNAPVNAPLLMGRHQFSYENDLFRRAIRIAVGAEARYNTKYNPAGYSALLNRFFYQNAYSYQNAPEVSAFLNFRIKRFRAYIMVDQLQKILVRRNTILYTGVPLLTTNGVSDQIPVYSAQDFMLRFGFAWALVN